MYGKGKSLSCYPHFTDEDTKAQRGGVVRSRLDLGFLFPIWAFCETAGYLAGGLDYGSVVQMQPLKA